MEFHYGAGEPWHYCNPSNTVYDWHFNIGRFLFFLHLGVSRWPLEWAWKWLLKCNKEELKKPTCSVHPWNGINNYEHMIHQNCFYNDNLSLGLKKKQYLILALFSYSFRKSTQRMLLVCIWLITCKIWSRQSKRETWLTSRW